LRYDLRKLKGHGLLERDGSRCYFCSSTNGCAAPLPTTASTTDH
jgi:hypothetical protein